MVRYTALRGLYELEKTIGCGGFAKVKLATHIATGEKVAIKIMEKAALGEDLPRVKLEVEAMKNLLHQHVCQLYQVIETDDYYFMIIEYCSGGELFDHIVEKSRLTESEARKFFRQIISAVAYIHSLGYAHRDLKPENVLLDKDQNLKLIDFGLCAKPRGGMQTHLYTSCGSPTYAAPELILGNKYLGSEIDIWSLGVLLYAILCGFLPFDDSNIENLYKKILNGTYDEPSWLSQSSKRLIRAMLQVDSRKRITITELCSHPWVVAGFLPPVTFVKRMTVEKDQEVLDALTTNHCENIEEIWKNVCSSNRTDYETATYLLLLDRKRQGFPVNVLPKSYILNQRNKIISESNKQGTEINKPIREVQRSPRGRKRLRSKDDFASPVPTKKQIDNVRQVSTPTKEITEPRNSLPSTPGSAKKVLSGIEKHFNRVKCILTPKRHLRNENSDPDEPRTFSGKGLCNISSTTSDSPASVLNKLQNALQCKGIICKQKGFILYGETEMLKQSIKTNNSKILPIKNTCSFELEVCLIKNIVDTKPIVGIRRKRLKGDAWVYKRVCEEILTLTAVEIPEKA